MTDVVELHHTIEGAGRDLVLFHGGGGGIDDLVDLRARLTPGRRIISPDQRGHGRSPEPGALSYEAMAADTAALLDRLEVRAADMVGWSDGAIVALLIARDRPELVRRVVAISGNAAMASQPSPLTPQAREYLAGMTGAQLPMPAGRDALPGAAEAWPATADRLVAMWRAGPGLTLDHLRSLPRPVLYVAADRDIVPLAHTAAMFEATPDAQLAIVPGTTHRLPQERPADVAALADQFLAGEG